MARRAKLNPALSTLYNAPDVRETRRLRGGIEELDPALIDTDGRLQDRLELDVTELSSSIAANGQRVPILVRPTGAGRHALIYGRRRLEACRQLGLSVRAIVTDLDDDQALKDQLLENQARRDLSFIERALVATALQESEQLPAESRTNRAVAEMLSLTEAGVSQMLSVVRVVGDDLIRAIGPCPGIGRPRWEELKRALSAGADRNTLLDVAVLTRKGSDPELSDKAFLAVLAAAQPVAPAPVKDKPRAARHNLAGIGQAKVAIDDTGTGLKLELSGSDPAFVSWLEAEAPQLIQDLHARWKQAED